MDSSGSELLKVLKAFTSGMTNNSLVDNQMKSLNSSHGLDGSLEWEIKASNLSSDGKLHSYNETFSEPWMDLTSTYKDLKNMLLTFPQYVDTYPTNKTTIDPLSNLLNTSDTSLHWHCVEYKLSPSEIVQIQSFSYWIEGVCQFVLGGFGIMSNLIAIPILCNKRLNNIFSKLLICLLVLHTLYIICVLLTEMMWPSWDENYQGMSETWFIFVFSYILHPFRRLMRYSSTFFTTLMARQRFLAIRHPIEYRNLSLTANPWKYVMISLILVIVTGAFFTFPLFLETSVEEVEVEGLEFNSTHFKVVSKREATLKINPIRLNWHYIIWYKNFTVILISLIVPFILLAYWNINTLAVMTRRRRLKNRPRLISSNNLRTVSGSPDTPNRDAAAALLNVTNEISANTETYSTSRQAKQDEGRRAKVLFAIVIFFVICNTPRVVLDLEEFVVIAPSYWNKYITIFNHPTEIASPSSKQLCYSPPFWARILHSISKLLLTLNASSGCLVYCAMCKIFRTALTKACHSVVKFVAKVFRKCSNSH